MKKQKSYWINKRSVRWKIIAEFATFRPRTYGYLINGGDEKKGEQHKKVCHKTRT